MASPTIFDTTRRPGALAHDLRRLAGWPLTMKGRFSMFSIKKTIGDDYNVDLDDSLATKQALNRLGYYTPPQSYGMVPYPERLMFDSLKAFQKDEGLRVDGLMRPGGPTEAQIGYRLAQAEGKTPHAPEENAGRNMPVIVPRNVDPKMPQLRDRFEPKSGPYFDQNGNLVIEGIHPRTGFPISRSKGPH
ncbi:MAG: peptidoglycan-binding domain-containing protein [Rhodospirillales bacterium]